MSGGDFIGTGFTSDLFGLNWSCLLIGLLILGLSLLATRIIDR